MKKVSLIVISMNLFLLKSCNSLCDDCGKIRGGYQNFILKNSLSDSVVTRWYNFGSFLEVSVPKMDTVIIRSLSTRENFGRLGVRPFNDNGDINFDSVLLYKSNDLFKTYYVDGCSQNSGILCKND